MGFIISTLTLLLLAYNFSNGDIIVGGSFQAVSENANIKLKWITQDESNIQSFEIERSSGNNNNFRYLASVTPKGPSMYEFIDYSTFSKTTLIYYYRIKVIFSNGNSPIYVGPISINHTVSGVRKTWGSIKAMFR